MSEDLIPELEFDCSVCKKPSIFDKEITYVGKVGSTQVQLCDSCSKNNDNMVLKTMYDRNLESELETLLDKMIKRGENNSNVGSFVSRCKFRYGHDRQNPFCNEPLNYVLKADLTEQYELDTFTKPLKDFLKDDTTPSKQQGLLTNSFQTDGNIFEDESVDTFVLQKIIETEVEKYRHKFKDSKEGFLKNWPEEYTLNGWLISMKSGGSIKPHMHEYGWLSGSIYINVPKKKTADSGNLVVCIDDEDETNKKSIDVVTGSLCLFPASLLHYTIPFESDEERIVLAFDVKPKGDDMAKEEVIIDTDATYKDPRAEYDDIGNMISQVYDDTPNLKRDAFGNVIGNVDELEEGTKFVITSPRTDEEYSFDTSVLTGADWTRMFNSADDIFTPEEIQNYYDIALDIKLNEGNDFPNGLGSEIKHEWIQEIWAKVNPGVQLLSHSINMNESCEFKVNAWAGNQYTVVVYLTPNLQPTDGGSLELWTPNLTDKTKAMAINTQYTFDMSEEYNKEIVKSYWPRPGRMVVFDSRIPNIVRPIETDKARVSLIFKGTSVGYEELSEETQFTVVE